MNYCLTTKAIPRRHMDNEKEASMASLKRILEGMGSVDACTATSDHRGTCELGTLFGR